MKNKKNATHVALLLTLTIIFNSTVIGQHCPPCFWNTYRPKPGPATSSTTGGKFTHAISFQFSREFDITPGVTNSTAWNAVRTALDQWNTADPKDYPMIIDQSKPQGQVSVIIKIEPPQRSNRARMTVPTVDPAVAWLHRDKQFTSSQFVLRLPADYDKIDPATGKPFISFDDLVGMIKHEVGHAKGLSHPNPELKDVPIQMPGTCKDSVMNPSNPDRTRDPETNKISSRDVAAAQRYRDNLGKGFDDRKRDCPNELGKEIFDQHGGDGNETWVYDYTSKRSEAGCIVTYDYYNVYEVDPDEGGLVYVRTEEVERSRICPPLEN